MGSTTYQVDRTPSCPRLTEQNHLILHYFRQFCTAGHSFPITFSVNILLSLGAVFKHKVTTSSWSTFWLWTNSFTFSVIHFLYKPRLINHRFAMGWNKKRHIKHLARHRRAAGIQWVAAVVIIISLLWMHFKRGTKVCFHLSHLDSLPHLLTYVYLDFRNVFPTRSLPRAFRESLTSLHTLSSWDLMPRSYNKMKLAAVPYRKAN